jgi:hypothetical protein
VSSLAFMSISSAPDADREAVARSPMARRAVAGGAKLERRGGWEVVVSDPSVGFADRSYLRKLELLGPHDAQLGTARLAEDGAWWCPIRPDRVLLVGGDAAAPEGALEMTCAYAAMELKGPDANETLARFCAIDVRAHVMPVGAFRPGSVARTPGYVLRTGQESLLLFVGWALGEYLWETVETAAAGVRARA